LRELKKGKYVSPEGTEVTFDYDIVSRETELKTGVFTYPARDGARVQHQGKGAVTFPLTCIFSGEDCMEQADAFEATLWERGTGELQHPIYGTVNVKPVGNINREDNLVSKVNESTVTVTFTEHIVDDDTETINAVAADSIEEKLEKFSEAVSEGFAEALSSIESLGEQIAAEAALNKQVQAIIDALEPLAMADKKLYPDWLASSKELKESVGGLYGKTTQATGKREKTFTSALNIARLALRLAKQPAKLATSLSTKIQGYSTLTSMLINQFKNDPFDTKKIKSAFNAAWLGLSSATASVASGSAVSIANVASSSKKGGSKSQAESGSAADSSGGGQGSSYSPSGVPVSRNSGAASREEAVEAASHVIQMLEDITSFGDSKIVLNTFVDANASSHMLLQEIVHESAQLIMNASFSLPMQRTFTLGRDRQVLELCAELYGTVDYLDDFIALNNFSADEIELLPMGTRVTYYVQST
jgi:hypothetical protein